MVLDAGKIIFRGEKHIEAVAGDRQAEFVGFLGAGLDHLRRDIFVEFNNLDAGGFFLAHGFARFVGSLDQIAALAAQRPGGRRADQPAAGGPNARAADLAQLGAVLLRQRPLVVVLGDVRASGDAEMEIKLADEIEQMAMAVDETGQDGFAFGVDDFCAARDRHFAALADRFDAFAFDDDDRIFDGVATGSVDQRAALNHQRRDSLRRRRIPVLANESRTRIGRNGEFDESWSKSCIRFAPCGYLATESMKPLFSN